MFFQKAQEGYNDWWRYVIVILVVFIGYFIGQIPLYLAVSRAVSEDPDLSESDLMALSENLDFSMLGINANMGFTLLIIMFLGAFTAMYFIFRPLHRREFRSLVTPSSRVNWSKIFFGFTIWLALGLTVELVAYIMNPEAYTFQFKINTFIPLVLISLFLLPIQTSTEEFIFRGYLMQGIGNGLRSKWAALVITSVLFGLTHSMNPEINEFGFGLMQSYYITAGLVLGLITIMDDGLELALGVHAATNFTGAVFVGYDGAAIQTESLFTTQELNPLFMLLAFIIISVIFIGLCKYKYNWGSFSKVLQRVEPRSDDLV